MMRITFESLKQPLKAIHAAPQMVVIEFAGAGAQALAWLHGLGGSSRTILEATDHYAAASLIETIGFEPRQFASPEVARALATRAYIRACQLADPDTPVAGVGCAATIATDRTKRGDHRGCVALCTAAGVTTYHLTLAKGLRARGGEENLISLLILKAVANFCGIDGLPPLQLLEAEALAEHFEPIDLLTRLLDGEFGWVAVSPDGRLWPGQSWSGIALLSGAFNPLHAGHRQLARVAAEMLQQEVYFELPLINAAKGRLAVAEAQRRVAQFADFATVILTRAPLFGQKAQLFPRSVFIIGADTAERLVQLSFYHDRPAEMRASFEAVRLAGCRFLVAGRLVHSALPPGAGQAGDRFLTLRDVALPAGYRELFQEIPAEQFRADISSTAIRADGHD